MLIQNQLPKKLFRLHLLLLLTLSSAQFHVVTLFAKRPPAPFLPEAPFDLTDIPHEELIYILGDDDYSLRLQAELMLLKLPHEELMHLTVNNQDIDLETQIRLLRVTEQAKSLLFKQKLQQFALGADPSVDTEVPGWSEFLKTFPEGNKFRKDYAAMIVNDPKLFSKWENVEGWESILNTRCYEITSGLDSGIHYQPQKSSTIHGLLYLTSLPDCKVNTTIGTMLYSIMSSYTSKNYRLNSTTDMNSRTQEFETMLLNNWISNAEIVPSNFRFSLGLRYDLPGTLVLCRKMIASNMEGIYLHDPICCLARLGDDSHIPVLVSLLKDDRHAGPSSSINSKAKQFGCQVRDIALACLVKKTNQNLSEYGFHNIRDNNKTLFIKYSTNFADENARIAAFKKWDVWAIDHLNEKGELVKKPDIKPHQSLSITPQ